MWQRRNIERAKKGSRKQNETPGGMWFSGAPTGSLWFCYTEPLAGKQKRGISGSRRRPKPTTWERNSWRREDEDEEEKPATERRREYTYLGSHLGKKEMSMSPAMPQLWR